MEKRSSAFNLLSPVDTTTVPPEIPKRRGLSSLFLSSFISEALPGWSFRSRRDNVPRPDSISTRRVAFARPVLVLFGR